MSQCETYDQLQPTRGMLSGGHFHELEEPAGIDTHVFGFGIEPRSIGFCEQIREEDAATSQCACVEGIFAVMTEDNLDVVWLVHGFRIDARIVW